MEDGAESTADGSKKAPISREQLLKYIKTQKASLKRADEEKALIAAENEELKYSSENQLSELKARGDKMREMAVEIEEAKARISALSEERDNMAATCEAASVKVEASWKETEDLRVDNASLSEELRRALEKDTGSSEEAQLRETEASAERARAALVEERARAAEEARAAADAAAKDIDELKSAHAAALADLQEKLTSAEAVATAQSAEIQTITTKMEDCKASLAKFQAAADAAANEVAHARQASAALESSNAAATGAVTGLEQKLSEAHELRAAAEGRAADVDRVCLELRDALLLAETKSATVAAEAASAHETAEARVAALEAQLATQAADAEAALVNAQTKSEGASSAVEMKAQELEKTLAAALEREANLQGALDGQSASANAAHSRVCELQQELDSATEAKKISDDDLAQLHLTVERSATDLAEARSLLAKEHTAMGETNSEASLHEVKREGQGSAGTSPPKVCMEDTSLEGIAPDAAVELVWARLQAFVRDHGKNRALELFEDFDSERSGGLGPKELKAALTASGFAGASNRIVAQVMKTVAGKPGSNSTGKVLRYHDFVSALQLDSAHSVVATGAESTVGGNSKSVEEEIQSQNAETQAAQEKALVDAHAVEKELRTSLEALQVRSSELEQELANARNKLELSTTTEAVLRNSANIFESELEAAKRAVEVAMAAASATTGAQCASGADVDWTPIVALRGDSDAHAGALASLLASIETHVEVATASMRDQTETSYALKASLASRELMLQERVAAAEASAKELQAYKAAHESETSATQERLAQLQQDVDEARAALVEERARAAEDARAAADAAAKDIDELKSAHAAALADLQEKLTSAEANLEAHSATQEKRATAEQETAASAAAQIALLEKELESAKEAADLQVREAQTNADALRSERDVLASREVELQERVAAAEASAKELQAYKAAHESETSATQERVAQLQQDVDEARGEATSATTKSSDLEEKLAATESALACEKEALQAAETRASEAANESVEIKAASEALEQRLKEISIAVEKLQVERDDALAAKEAAEAQVPSSEAAASSAQEEDNLRTSLHAEQEKASVAEATIQALKEAMQVLEDKEVAAAKTIEDLQVKERKLKQLLTKQKAVIKSKDDEAKASQEERFKALELSSELNSRGDALRRVTDELDAVKASLAEETSKRSQAEGHFAAAQRSLASAEASAADSAKRILTSDTALADLRSQFDDYKRRTAAMLERGASSEESDRTKAISGATQDMEEFNAYKKRSSEALRQANESVAKYRAAAQRNRDEDSAFRARVEELEAKEAAASEALAKAEARASAATAEAEAMARGSESLKAALERLTAELEFATARASASESQAESIRKKAEEDAAAAASASAELSKVEKELAKAQSQSAFLTTMTLHEDKPFEKREDQATKAAPVPGPPHASAHTSDTSDVSTHDTAPEGSKTSAAEDSASPEAVAPESDSSRKLNTQLQTELAETTLKFGDAIEKLREQEQKYADLSSKFELERQLRTGNEAIRNAEYLKHVVLKYMVSTDRNEQAALLPVISEMLKFTKVEDTQVQELLSRGALRRLGGGIKGFILGPGT